jgi:hypothetical protein
MVKTVREPKALSWFAFRAADIKTVTDGRQIVSSKPQIFYSISFACFMYCTVYVIIMGVGGDQGPEPRFRFALQPLGLLYTLFSRSSHSRRQMFHVLRDVRDPSSESWNFNGRERVAENFA